MAASAIPVNVGGTMTLRLPLALASLLLVFGAVARAASPDAGNDPTVPGATTLLQDARGATVGRVTLTDTPHGLLVRGSLIGVPRGAHAIHFHETGTCEPPFKTAGGHFNPGQKAHGMLDVAGPHAGDMPNLVVPKDGSLEFEFFVQGLTLAAGPSSLFDTNGTSIVLHARADDYRTQPAGDSGDRIACGVVTR